MNLQVDHRQFNQDLTEPNNRNGTQECHVIMPDAEPAIFRGISQFSNLTQEIKEIPKISWMKPIIRRDSDFENIVKPTETKALAY